MTDWLPNFFIAGAPKAGTSSIHQWIADHPDAAGPREKETYFFVDPGTHMHRPKAHIAAGLESWADQFTITTGDAPNVIVESTPSYLYSRTALEHIPTLATLPKCLFILREPAAQVHSLYTYFRNNWSWIPAEMSFADFLVAVRAGGHSFGGNELAQNALAYARYAEFLDPWRAALGEERMMVRGFDELLADEIGFTKSVAAWVGLDPAFYDSYTFPRENETYVPRNRALQRLNVAIREKLPKGALYRGARSLYRKLNTAPKASGRDLGDAALIAGLRDEFAAANTQLAERYGVIFAPVQDGQQP
ncbi:sulfotransferase [Qipengyuania marisflavi]|uniref:Sulfotransferase n=1 Tax=Qipengyuania marisflavi TaxID=2486356 RepID=A0A5S3P1Z5_9SPHN|nr:sulfotransferase [Qipengyuania marisflavi]TMM46744.1 sulfotransferase [Qipengyuania marisflavi]